MLHPPAHRGPLIATGAVVIAVGVGLQQIRLDWDAGWQTLLTGTLAALFLWLALQAPLEGGRPPAYQSVLIVSGLLALLLAIGWLLEAILEPADDGFPAPRITAMFALHSVASALVAARRNSGIATLLAALSAVGAVLAFWEWLFDPGSATPFRWLLLVLAITFVVVSLALRAPRPRPSEQLVNAAGLAILAIPLIALIPGLLFAGFGSRPPLGGFWELVVLATGFGLVAYAAVDRAPGPAYLGVANLAAFAGVTSITAEDTLEWWPLTLLVIGLLLLFAGLRPVRPLPPEPRAYRAGEVPLSVRVEGDETVIRVHE